VRRRQEKNEKLTQAELGELRVKLREMTSYQLAIEYKAIHNACRSPDHLPSPSLIQELVQVWKELRRRRQFPRIS
jgi:hypothetical protein